MSGNGHPCSPGPDNSVEPVHSGGDCILCGRCLQVCPLFQATGREEFSPRAKFLLAGRAASGEVELDRRKASDLAALCLSCGRCEKACAQNLCAPDLAAGLREKHPGFREWLWKQWITRAGLLWPLGRTLARAFPGALPGAAGAALEDARTLSPENAPAPWVRAGSPGTLSGLEGKSVLFFPGCTARHARPGWMDKSLALLSGLGARSSDPGFACCGCTLGHAGQPDLQRAMQMENVAHWRERGRPLIAVICATCRCGLKSYARTDLGWEPGEAETWRKSVTALSALLEPFFFDRLENAPDEVYYHHPCHGSGDRSDANLVRRLAGERFQRENADACCGFGGVVRLARPDLPRKVAATLWEKLAPEPGSQVLTGCSACVLQLQATAPEGVLAGHWLDILA